MRLCTSSTKALVVLSPDCKFNVDGARRNRRRVKNTAPQQSFSEKLDRPSRSAGSATYLAADVLVAQAIATADASSPLEGAAALLRSWMHSAMAR